MFIRYLFLEIKRSIHVLPKILIGALGLLIAMTILATIGINVTQNSNKTIEKSVVAMYFPDGNTITDMALGIVENMESINTLCEFKAVKSEAQVESMVKNGESIGGVIFPKDFIKGVMDGTNSKPTLILPKGSNMGNKLFENLAQSGCSILASVQAGIYSAQKAYKFHNRRDMSFITLGDINMRYIDAVLARNKTFSTTLINGESDLKIPEYYASMAITMLMLLLGMAMSPIVSGHSKAFYDKLKMAGIGFMQNTIATNIILFLIYLVLYCTLLLLLPLAKIQLQFNIFALIFPPLLCSVFVILIYRLCSDRIYGGLLIFALTLFFGFIGGAFLPTSLLPTAIKGISRFSPVNIIGNQIMGMFSAYDITSLYFVLGFLAIVYLLLFLKGGYKK